MQITLKRARAPAHALARPIRINSGKGTGTGTGKENMRSKSLAIHQKACEVIPGGVSSPVRAFPNLGLAPLIVSHGEGDTIWDVDGNSYIDFCQSWGALILGHAHKKVVQAAIEQVEKGSSFGITTAMEEELASLIAKHMPSIEKIRFVSSGTEATMSAVRLARGFTGRSLILKFNGNYHGHSDSLLIQAGSGVTHLTPTSSSLGVPEEFIAHTRSLPYNATDTVRAFLQTEGEKVAAVLVEPVAGNMGLVQGTPAFLKMLREETQKCGALLIFDEVISGFRVGLNGAEGLYGITPDLCCLGKIIGGGFPAAAFGGQVEIMNHLAPLGKVYQAGTLSGNPVAMCAGIATLLELENPGFYEELERKSQLFAQPIVELIQKRNLAACLHRQGSMFTLFLGPKKVTCSEDLAAVDFPLFKEFFTFLFQKGIYIPQSPYETAFISAAHTDEHLAYARDLIIEFLLRALN